MSLQLKITRVMDEGSFQNEHGEFASYSLDLETLDGSQKFLNSTGNRKMKSDGSHKGWEEGEIIWADLLPTKDPNRKKVKLDYDAMKNGGGAPRQFSSSSETSTSNNSKSKDDVDWDAKEARITRQAVLKVLSPTINQEGLSGNVRATVEELEQFISEAPKRPLGEALDLSGARTSEPGQGLSQGAVPASSSPQVSPPLGTAPDSISTGDDHQWIENLLVQGGATPWAAGILATYAIKKLRPDDLKKCEAILSHLDTQSEGRKRLETSYEKAEGHPVQQAGDIDDLPF